MPKTPLVITVKLEEFAADLLAAAVDLLLEVEDADAALIPDAVAEAAAETRTALDKWRAGA